MNLIIGIIIIVVIVVIILSFSGRENFTTEQVSWGEQSCGPNSTLTTIGDYQICLPQTGCTSETCPPELGTCVNNNTCQYKGEYKGVETYPHAMSTYYCNLSEGGCHGVTQNNYPEINAATIANNFGLKLCDKNDGNNNCVGIAASSPMIVGNSQEAKIDGKIVDMWGQGMTEYTGICYELTGPTGKKAIVALTDRCGGYCTCGGKGPMECGPCVSAPDMKPNCPCVGTVPGLYDDCCGLSNYGCPSTQQACDWCSSNNHPHFDLDTGTYNHLADGQGELGSIELKSVRPVKCMNPLPWPPSGGGGGGYVSCPSGTWDTGKLGPDPNCSSGRYLKPGDNNWPGSKNANHWCCITGDIPTPPSPVPAPPVPTPPIPTPPVPRPPTPTPPVPRPPVPTPPFVPAYVPCPLNTWDTGKLGPDPGCASGNYLKPGDPNWPNSQNANHWCCSPGGVTPTPPSAVPTYIPCPSGTWDTGKLGPDPGCMSDRYLRPGDPDWPNSVTANHWCCDTS